MTKRLDPTRLGAPVVGPENREFLLSTRCVMSSTAVSPLEHFDLASIIHKAVQGNDLTAFEAEFAFDVFMEGEASQVQMAALLTALRAKGEAPVEVAGGVKALRKAMIPIEVEVIDDVIDTCGTGGGTVTTFNISTAAALVARGAGATIAKHGNRSFTSRSGSADVLEALGVRIGDARGNVAPLRTIRSAPRGEPMAGLGTPSAIAWDSRRDQLLVPN